MDSKSSSFEKRARIDLLDLKEQTEGEGHIFFRSQIVRAKMFYAAPPPVKKLKLNQFLKVEAPSDDFLAKLFAQLKHFSGLLSQNDFSYPPLENNEVIQRVVDLISQDKEAAYIDASLQMLLNFEEKLDNQTQFEDLKMSCPEGHINIFSELLWPNHFPTLQSKNFSDFTKPILEHERIHQIFTAIESISGEKIQTSQKIASELINDLNYATLYPAAIMDDISGSDLAQMVEFISDKIKRVVAAK